MKEIAIISLLSLGGVVFVVIIAFALATRERGKS